MSDFVFYPVTGDGESAGTAFTWQPGPINFNTGSFWAAVASFETLTIGGTVSTGTVPATGDNAGLIAGAISPGAFALYQANPANGDPFIASSSYPVDVLLNSGSVELNNMVLAGFNQFASVPFLPPDAVPQFPTLDVEGAALTLTGDILDTGTVTFPTINVPIIGPINSATASGGGTIDLGSGATVTIAGATPSDITFNFNDANNNTLTLNDVTKGAGTIVNTFLGTITGFVPGDTLLLPSLPLMAGGIATTGSFDVASGVLTISVGDPTTTTLNIPNLLPTSGPVTFQQSGTGLALVTCFAAGTRVRTTDGETTVEHLHVGELLPVARGGEPRAIRWIGRRHIDCRRHPDPRLVWPVLVAAHAFAENTPARDLLLSPDHAVFVDGVLVPVKYLINGCTIRQMPRDDVTYYHVELDQHDVILAEGLAVESYLDTGDRGRFENGGGVMALHPDFSALRWEALGCAPLMITGPEVGQVRLMLAARAGRIDGAERRALVAA